ncbi:DEAD/DEAH box helicase family protein [Pseudarthrobacter sp. AL07]|uniref:DEAD/DEAH box helicase n=2 Tax=Micrococcaceae TaxID=1268 RepID=UPI002499B624|nr:MULTISPECIES: type ISP restriction/modification enzyme [unclassified Pseudarthrobacter]MDI3195425.1 DEAD/DEAH box helicase family protein [Pseudarthrobacter sp. AL20]MDI3209491.1 DEAD/DEAH box helicase family protein [Pseudarthrobacter sp. AL07]
MATTFDVLLDSYRDLADSERMKGNYFEQLVGRYLEKDGVQAPQYRNVWLWRDWPGRDGKKDNGIDLVAERQDGGFAAIQCKFYAEHHRIQKADIDSFIAASGKPPFTHRLIVDTTGRDWSPNAEEMLDNQHLPIQRIGLTDFRNSNIDWATYELTDPSRAPQLHEKKQLRTHQHEAVNATLTGFESNHRGKLIMACGTGKTFTALKIAERVAEQEGHARILFLVPSLALMSQSLKEWSDETTQTLHAYAVCSDTKVGRQKNSDFTDVAIHDLQIPATTDGATLLEAMGTRELDEGMTVVFSTYQSIDAVSQAQKAGLPDFDLIICDEAHRTTGATLAGTEESHFVKVHRNDVIAGAKRLYMTATPRLFNDDTKNKALERDAILCSMDDETMYGPVFYRIGFGEAVTKKLLTDYKVLVLGVEQSQVVSSFQDQLADSDMELQIDDVAKLIGCWNGLAKRRSGTHEASFGNDLAPMKRAVAFNRDIKSSKLVESEFPDLVRVHLTNLDNDDPTDDLKVEVKHVDGGFNAITRAERLDWLKEDLDGPEDQPVCRILTNARCLTEGVDVPSLDAVLFLNPRNSMVDVIQAVGRVMRIAKGKQFGYIILPIAIPEGMSTSEALRDNNRYKVVWQVLQALRAHDERMDAAINQIELNHKAPESILVDTVDLAPKKKARTNVGGNAGGGEATGGGNGDAGEGEPAYVQPALQFPVGEWKDSVYAKIVDKCGNRMYWEDWSKDIADIANKHITLINALLTEANPEHRKAFDDFIQGLQENLNPEIDQAQAVEMLAQHLVTKPVFDAMFTDSNFTEHNPVSLAMQNILNQLDDHSAFEKERAGLEKFYDSVRARVKSIDNAAAKQKIILELYDNFFRNAFPRVADRLGIVFTPVPVVDYILRSADAALRLEFGKSLSDEGVSILEPFVGTGTFVTRLLQSGLIKPEDLHRKYTQELFANEIVLLSYYIAAINIETVFAEESNKHGLEFDYVPFDGIALTDTFQLNESDGAFDSVVFPENSNRVQRQKNQDIRVIVMNPPYSVGQTSANDNNKNQSYLQLDASIASTYVANSSASSTKGLYDSYIRGIRWASNRIVDDGVIAFVSNGSFIDGSSADGIRKTFANEFSRIFIYNLRGNQRTAGEVSRKEGGKIFGSGARTPIAIAILIKNSAHRGPVDIQYRDIGDYLTREQKLDILEIEQSLEGTDWEAIKPSDHGDWINHRDPSYDRYQPIGDKKDKQATPTFETFSLGLATGRDAWATNFSAATVEQNMSRMIDHYNDQLLVPDMALDLDPQKISWNRNFAQDRTRQRRHSFDPTRVVSMAYRPFTKQLNYFDRSMNAMVYQLPRLFPTQAHQNLAIGVSTDYRKDWSALICRDVPDLTFVASGQFFSLYSYEPVSAEGQDDLFSDAGGTVIDGYRRRDNITDATLSTYRGFYEDAKLTKEDVFYYVYGLLHSPVYKERYKADLMKMLPRIPKVRDFWGFSNAGRNLAELHLNYETVDPYPLEEIVSGGRESDEYEFHRVTKLSFGARKDRSRIIYNQRITLAGIPAEAYDYQVNGKSAVEWIIDRYQVTTHKDSQITNNPNDYCREVGDPRYILDLIKRMVTVSVETMKIVGQLPPLEILE